jgi:hypothetical protein
LLVFQKGLSDHLEGTPQPQQHEVKVLAVTKLANSIRYI